jgi:hypothetical protein
MVAQPRAATVMGLLEEARLARMRGFKVAQKNGSMKTAFGRFQGLHRGELLTMKPQALARAGSPHAPPRRWRCTGPPMNLDRRHNNFIWQLQTEFRRNT